MADLQPLISRLEKVEGPDRELDAEIYASIGAVPSEVADPITGTEIVWIFNGSIGFPPKFTASLDAAVGLVPEGKAWGIEDVGAGNPLFEVYAGDGDDADHFVVHKLAAIALCIAALKARASEEANAKT